MQQRRTITCFVTLSFRHGSWPVSKIALMYDVDGKTAVITGAASGMGLGMARSFANAGMKLVLAEKDLRTRRAIVQTISSMGPHGYLGLEGGHQAGQLRGEPRLELRGRCEHRDALRADCAQLLEGRLG